MATPALAAAAEEFIRARAAFEGSVDGSLGPSADPVTYYRLRDLALATLDFCRQLLVLAEIEVDTQNASVAGALAEWLGADADVHAAVTRLVGLTNAHALSFVPRPPADVLAAGRSAGVVVAAFLDALLGDTYIPEAR